ncbi:acetyltransferase, partial [Lacticaseibacillus paracasei]|nr:acetyltransferase [Lacticaseibacillus paracasei]MCT3375267.1 acetyltransferase [Lacticaseibacillus paracasei]
RNLRVRTLVAMAQVRPITLEASYTPVSNRAGSRSVI